MAKTFVRRRVGLNVEHNPVLSYAARFEPEGASQTYTAGSPLVHASGLLIQSTSPISSTNKAAAIAIEAGENVASGGMAKIVPIVDGVMFYANLCATGGGAGTFAAADVGASYTLELLATLLGTGKPGWHIGKTAGT